MNNLDVNEMKIDDSIEKWLRGLSHESFTKVFFVCNILHSVEELSKTSIFLVPYDAFEKANLDSTRAEAILIEIWKVDAIDLVDCLEDTCVQSWNKDFMPDNHFSTSTMVNLKAKFDDLCGVLRNIKSKMIVFPEGIDYVYRNKILFLRLRDGEPDVLDLSNATLLRPVFESFYLLYKNGVNNMFTRRQLLDKHKEITGKDILWDTFVDRKNSINGKMINKKESLRNRIKWEHIGESDQYRFEILPLSDK